MAPATVTIAARLTDCLDKGCGEFLRAVHSNLPVLF